MSMHVFLICLGAFGKVFKGQLSTKDSRDVAIKTIKSMLP